MNEPPSESVPAVVPKITLELAKRLRARVLEEKSKDKDLSYSLIAHLLLKEFTEYKVSTLKAYVTVTGEVTDNVFALYVDGKVSWTVLSELGQSSLDRATIEFLAIEFVSRNMELKALRMVKAMLRDPKHRYSVAEALARATGQLPSHAKPKTLQKVMDSFGSIQTRLAESMMRVRTLSRLLVDTIKENKIDESFDRLMGELLHKAIDVRSTSAMMVDLLPVTSFDRGVVKAEFFEKCYLARHLFKEHYEFCQERLKDEKAGTGIFERIYSASDVFKEHFEFCDKRAQELLAEVMQFVSSESQMAELRKKGQADGERTGSGGEGREEGAQDQLPEVGSVLQDRPGLGDGEGRVEAQADPGSPSGP